MTTTETTTGNHEMRVALALLRRLPDIEIVEPKQVRFQFTGGESCAIKELRARFTPSAAA